MLYLIQLALYCLVFTLACVIARNGSPVNVLYFFPDYIQKQVFERGLTDKKNMVRKRNTFIPLLFFLMAGALLLIIGGWNGVRDFNTAFQQALFFLQGWNIYDGLVMDKVWLEIDDFWTIPGIDKNTYIPSWPRLFVKRLLIGLVLIPAAYLAAKLVLWIYS